MKDLYSQEWKQFLAELEAAPKKAVKSLNKFRKDMLGGGAKTSEPFTKDAFPKDFNKPEEFSAPAMEEHIVKRDDEFCLMSKKSNKNLGCYPSRKGAEKRERQVQYFKHMDESEVEEDALFKPLSMKQKAHSSKLIRIKYKDRPLDKDGIIDPKVAKGEKESLNEIKMEQVLPRFESKAFLKAVEIRKQNIAKKGSAAPPSFFSADAQKSLITAIIPADIQEQYKAEILNWLITSYINFYKDNPEASNFPFAAPLAKVIETFYQIKEAKMDRILSKSDIYSIKDALELYKIIEDAKPAWETYKQSRADKDAGAGTNKIYEDENWEVFIPENKGAACKLGKDTQWCTAAPGLEYYKHYHKQDDPLIIFISKSDPAEKYQFHYGSEQFMDRKDQSIHGTLTFVKLNDIVKKLANKLPEKVNKSAQKYKYEELPDGGYRIEDEDTVKTYDSNGELNSYDDEPSLIGTDGTRYWNKHGLLHRDNDLPAVIYPNGSKEWYQDGKMHRDNDHPAAIHPTGIKYWYQNGQRHRDNDLPAVIYPNGSKEWWKNGRLIKKEAPSQQLKEMIVQELRKLIEEKKDRCYQIAKRKYKAFPSAYASGAIVKCRQGKIWKKEK
jgi:hypothetical protein